MTFDFGCSICWYPQEGAAETSWLLFVDGTEFILTLIKSMLEGFSLET